MQMTLTMQASFRPAILFSLALSFAACTLERPDTPPVSQEVDGKLESEVSSDTSKADVYLAQGMYWKEISRFDSAMNSFRKASLLYKEQSDWEGQAASLNGMASCATKTGDFIEGGRYAREALEIGLFHFGKDNAQVARSYYALGIIEYRSKNIIKGKEYCEKALEIQSGILGLRNTDVAASYTCLASIHSIRGDYDRAIELENQAISIWQEYKGNNHARVAAGYYNIGYEYMQKGNRDAALSYFNKAIPIQLSTTGARSLDVALTYDGIGSALIETNIRLALEYHYQAQDIFRELFGDSDPFVAGNYNKIARAYWRNGNYKKASKYLNKDLDVSIAALGPRHHDVAWTYNDLGDLFQEQGHFDRALAFYNQALEANSPSWTATGVYENPPLDSYFSAPHHLKALGQKAHTLVLRFNRSHRISDLRAAIATYLVASRLVGQMRHASSEETKLFTAEQTIELYDEAIAAALQLYRVTGEALHRETAFRFAEEGKAAVLLDAFAEVEAQSFAGIPDSLLQRERQLHAEITFARKQLAVEEPPAKKDKPRAATTPITTYSRRRNELFQLRRQYDALLERFEQDYPDYHRLKHLQRRASIEDIQRQLEPTTALVEYFLGKDSLYVFTLRPDHFSIKVLPRPQDIEGQVERFREAIVGFKYKRYMADAHHLYRQLIAPVRADLGGAEDLIIVPDGVLSYVPFEALLIRPPTKAELSDAYSSLPYLLRDYAVSYAYSSTLLWEMKQRQVRRARAGQGLEHEFIAFAPVFKDGLPEGTRAAEVFASNQRLAHEPGSPRGDLPAGEDAYLPASLDEVRQIVKLFRRRYGLFERFFGERSQAYVEEAASEARFKSEELSRYRYVHLATHGFVNEAEPELSGIVLSTEGRGRSAEEDGIVHLGEVYGLRLEAELVVLSACETGLGRLAQGEGVIGMTRGFFYAGASSVLVSLWKASDGSTGRLMVGFYDALLEADGEGKARALRRAKLRLLQEDASLARPYYWSSFVLVGA